MIALAVVVKSLILFAAFSISRLSNSLYSNPQCAMRLVNESDPVAYSRHPYWKDLHYDDSCAGDKLNQYVKNQYYNDERYWMDLAVNTWTVIGSTLVLGSLVRWLFKGNLSIKTVLTSVVLAIFAYFGALIVLMHTHFEVDITYMCGGILHHARADKPGIDDKANSVTEGYLYCGGMNRLFYTLVAYWLITKSDRLKKLYNPWLAIGLLQLILLFALRTVGGMHPVYHQMAANGSTPAMDNAWPYTKEWAAYMHCIVHHDNGLSFSGDFFLDPVWDAFLFVFAFLHNTVFQIQLGSLAHFGFSTVLDMAMGIMGVVIMYVILHLGVYVIPSSSVKGTDTGKKLN